MTYSGLVVWLATVLILNTLIMVAIAHADRGTSTLKDDERFRNGLVRDLKMIIPNKCTRTVSKISRINLTINCSEKSFSNSMELKQSTQTVLDEIN